MLLSPLQPNGFMTLDFAAIVKYFVAWIFNNGDDVDRYYYYFIIMYKSPPLENLEKRLVFAINYK